MLKSLELFGFKSFADRTTFEFSRGVTGVVGPNGSGKSNIVDAIKWLLGTQSAKSLRGKEMTDVVFNGATGRKANQFAEAVLTFDNTSGFLPVDLPEVSIGRRIWNSGDAEYLINNNVVRLKDVRELLMGSGAGTAAYCIIEQGRVDQILQANASARRVVFEEAAGISRYKARKNEAQRKLERVDQNLLRLTDIVDELEGRLTSTRNQAAKAAKYRELSNELKELWLGLAADDHRHLAEELQQIEKKTQELATSIGEFNSRQQELQAVLAECDTEIAEVDHRLHKTEHQNAAVRESIAGREATIRHQSARLEELETEIRRLHEQRVMMRNRVREAIDELEQTRTVMSGFERNFARKQSELSARAEQIRDLAKQVEFDQKELESKREHVLTVVRELSDLENRQQAIESQLEATHTSDLSAKEKLQDLSEQIDRCRSECEQRRLKLQLAVSHSEEAERRVRQILENRRELLGERDQFQQSLAEQRELRSAWHARIGVLEDFEIRQEGLGIGVREILSRATTSDYPPWNRIVGSVAELIDVDLEHAALLEVALADRAQLIVIEDYDSLREYLNSGSCRISGRVGFLVSADMHVETGEHPSGTEADDAYGSAGASPSQRPPQCDRFQINPAAVLDLSEHAGVVQRADVLARSSAKAPHLLKQLLADTWIVETLDVAFGLATGAGRGCRFVTLQGELLQSDGSLFVGMLRSETALVSRKSELRQLKNDLKRLDRDITGEESRISNLGDSLDTAGRELEDAEGEARDLIASVGRLKSELSDGERDLQNLHRDRANIEELLAELTSRAHAFQTEVQETQMEVARKEEDLRVLQSDIEAGERDVSRLVHRRQTLQQKQTTDQLEFAKHEERLNSLESERIRCERECDLRTQQQDETERRFLSIETKKSQLILNLLNTNAVLSEQCVTEEQLSGKARAETCEKDRLRENQAALRKDEAGIRNQRGKLDAELHQEEIQSGDLRHRMTTLEERIQEEYQLALSHVVDSGASAFHAYLSERQSRESGEPKAESGSDSTIHPDVRSPLSALGFPPEGPAFDEVRDDLEARVNRLRRKLKHMGNVDSESLQDLDEMEERFAHLSTQLEDLVEAKIALDEIIRRINSESKRMFAETFTSVRGHFQELFRKLFGGGEGDIILEDPEDILECGVDVVARPPGKELRSISLLSGGEKTMTAVALLMAIFKTHPSPFCILDEVDAALDEANIDRFLGVLREFQETTQFIVITHRKPTMAVADTLYGVTMEQSGVSKRMTVRFDDVNEDGQFAVGPDLTSTQDGQLNDAA